MSKPYDLALAFTEGDPDALKAALEAQPTPIKAAGLACAVLESARGLGMSVYREINYAIQQWGGWY